MARLVAFCLLVRWGCDFLLKRTKKVEDSSDEKKNRGNSQEKTSFSTLRDKIIKGYCGEKDLSLGRCDHPQRAS